MKRIRSKGISQIELIVICVCCLIASAMAVSLIHQSRSQSRNATCLRNLRLIALSTHDFSDAHARIPAGVVGSSQLPKRDDWDSRLWQDHQLTSSFGLLMPFMEMPDYKSIDQIAFDYRKDLTHDCDEAGNRLAQWFGEIGGITTGLTSESGSKFQCPEDNDFTSDGVEFVIAMHPVYAMNPIETQDRMWVLTLSDLHKKKPSTIDWGKDKPLTHTNYLACVGAHCGGFRAGRMGKYNGVMSTRGKVSLATIAGQDGTSKTIMFGETIGEFKDSKRTQVSSFLFGAIARGRGLVHWGEEPTELTSVIGSIDQASVYGFGSMHKKSCNFVFCDGAVWSLSREIDIAVFDQLCGRDDGGEPDFERFAKNDEK